MSGKTALFDPLEVGAIALRNRIVMAPMTRSRADDDGVPGGLTATYYAQRATAGLIISEAVYISPMGKGYVRIPGLHTKAQVAGWRKVTEAVHAGGGRIFAQLFHCGRISDPLLLPDGAMPVAPSAVRPIGQSYTPEGMKPHPVPRALETEEIPAIVAEYGRAAGLAMEAGFDGVELHAASGYLPEQFLSTKTNLRTDRYGGSLENRARFVLEALDAMIAVAGASRVGIKIAPEMDFNDIADANPRETYDHLVREIAARAPAYLHVALFGTKTDYHGLLRPLFGGAYFAGGGFVRETAVEMLAEGRADAIAFGSLFLANPDLPERLRRDAPLNSPNRDTFYTPGPVGYVDYPALPAPD